MYVICTMPLYDYIQVDDDKHYTLLFIGRSPIAFVRCSLSDHIIRVSAFRVVSTFTASIIFYFYATC